MTGFDLQAEARQSRSRKTRLGWLLGMAAVVMLLTIMVSYWKSLKRAAHATSIIQTLPKDVDRSLSGYTFTRSEGGRQIFIIHAARTLALKNGGKTLLQDVHVEVFGREGNRHDSLTAGQCENDRSGALSCSGKAQIELSSQANLEPSPDLSQHQPLYLNTSDVSYHPHQDIVRTDAPVSFRLGPASGSARGLAYATKDGWLRLNRDVMIHIPSKQSGKGNRGRPPLDLSAASLFYRKETGEVSLQGLVKVTQGNCTLTAPEATIDLDAQSRVHLALLQGGIQATEIGPVSTLRGSAQNVQWDFDPSNGGLRDLIATGSVRLTGMQGAAGNLRSLQSDRLQVNFLGPKNLAQNGTATGNVKLSVLSPRDAAGTASIQSTETQLSGGQNTLTASELDFAFQGGRMLQSASTPGPGKLVLLPGKPGVGKREITAGRFAMSFDALGRLTTLQGFDSSHVKFFPPPAGKSQPNPQESFSDHLEAGLNPNTEEVETIRQGGHFRYVDGDRHATAEQAEYASASGLLTLTGDPLLLDPDTRIRALRFCINTNAGTATGQGKVQSTHFPPAKTAAKDRTPQDDEADAINVIASKVFADRPSQLVHYEGHVRAWTRSDVVESPSLDILKSQRRIVSGAGVVTSLQPASLTPKNPASKPHPSASQPVTIRADRLLYFDAGREARYLGHVQMETGGAVLHADQLNVYFSQPSPAGDSEVERAVAAGHVVVTEPGRRATGNHAEYFAQNGKIVMTGGPPTVYDEAQGFTTGRRLTFFIDGASLTVDGGKKDQTLSKRLMVHE